MRGLPTQPAPRAALTGPRGDLSGLVFQIPDEGVALTGRREQAQQTADRPRRTVPAYAVPGRHPAIIRFNMPVAAASAPEPAGVRR